MSFEAQIMFKDKYVCIFPPKMVAIVFNIIDSNVFHDMHSIVNWGISLRYSPVLAEGYSVM